MAAVQHPAGTALADTDAAGAFKRTAAAYRNRVGADGPFQPAGTRTAAAGAPARV